MSASHSVLEGGHRKESVTGAGIHRSDRAGALRTTSTPLLGCAPNANLGTVLKVSPNASKARRRARGWCVPSIAIFLFPGVEELDFVGPWEVLRSWQKLWPDDGVDVFLLAEQPGPVECAKGMRVLPECTWSDGPSIDVLVYPGGQGTRRQLGDERFRTWLSDLRADGTIITSVCTGALVLAVPGCSIIARRRPTGRLSSIWPDSAPEPNYAPMTGSSTAGRSSPPPGSRPASTWHFTSSDDFIRSTGAGGASLYPIRPSPSCVGRPSAGQKLLTPACPDGRPRNVSLPRP